MIVLLALMPGGLVARQNTLDSLLQQLKSSTGGQSSATLLNQISQQHLGAHPDSALYYAQRALESAIQADDAQWQIASLKAATRAYLHLGQYDLAQVSTTRALALCEKSDNSAAMAEVLNQSAIIYMYKGAYDSAVFNLERALGWFEEHQSWNGQAAALNILGNIYQKKGEYLLASDYLHKALACYQKAGDTGGEADALNNIGVIYELQHDYTKALQNYQRSYEVYKRKGDSIGVAIGLHNAGIILKKSGNPDSAVYNFKAALALDLDLGAMDGVVYDLKELGEAYVLLDQLDTAFSYFHEALKLSVAFQDPVVTVPTLIGLGNIHTTKGQYDSAFFYLNQALGKAGKFEMKNEQMEAAGSLSQLYDKQGDFKRSLDFYRMHVQLKDDLFNEESIRKLALVEAEYKFEQRRTDQEMKERMGLLEKDREVAEAVWIRNTSFAGIVVISMLAYLLYFNYQRKRKVNVRLNRLNEELKSAYDEIRDINASLEDKIGKRTNLLQQRNEKLEAYIYSNSHVVRAPVARILALVELYKSGGKDLKFINQNIYDSAIELDNILKEIDQTLKFDKEQ